MADSSEITPSRSGPAPGPVEFALAAIEGALNSTRDACIHVREVRRIGGKSDLERGLRELGELLRNLKHLGAEGESVVQMLIGYDSGRVVSVVPVRRSSAKRVAVLMGAVAALITALAAAWSALAGKGK